VSEITSLVAEHQVLVCCGSGGVGKTTIAAVLALEGARQGRNTCVITIDPAKRLADALGLETLSDTPSSIERDRWDDDGTAKPDGALAALMLDTKSTFDRLVTGNAVTPDQAQRILDNRIFRLLMMPTRAYLKVASVAVQTFLRTVARVVGSEAIDDVVAFFRAFEGMEAGFRDRALAVEALLASPDTGFVLVTSPRRDAMEEAQFFARQLDTNGKSIDALIVNRVHPKFGDESPAGLRAAAAELEQRSDDAARRLAARYENLADFREIAELERDHVEGIQDRVGAKAIAYVPYLSRDVYDFGALREIGTILFAANGSADATAV